MKASYSDGTKTMIDQDMAERIRVIIKEKGGYDQFSQISNINRQTLIRIATGKSEPKISHIVAIAQESGVDIKDIVYGKEANDFIESFSKEARQEEEQNEMFSYISNIRKKLNHRMSEIEHEYVELRRALDKKTDDLEAQIKALTEKIQS